MKVLAILLLLAVLIVFILFDEALAAPSEAFATKREKAAAILDWFGGTSRPSYSEYRAALGSTIVEYEDMMQLSRGKDLTLDAVSKSL